MEGNTMKQSIKNGKMDNEVNVQAVSQKFPKPPVVTRAEWGCPDPDGTKAKELGLPKFDRKPTIVTHLIIHNTGSKEYWSKMTYPQIVLAIWANESYLYDPDTKNHFPIPNTNYKIPGGPGWGDIGYNYLVDPNGYIYEGRAGGDNIMGAHFNCVNGNTMGVALIGDFRTGKQLPTKKAIRSLKYLLAWKCDKENIDPIGKRKHADSWIEDLPNICGHQDGNNKPNTNPKACPDNRECPGKTVYDKLPSIRNEVKQFISRFKRLPFTDVAQKHWAKSWIEEAFILGIMPEDDLLHFKFNPERSVTRAETAKHLLQTIKGTDFYPPKPKHIFDDMKYKDNEEWAEEFYNKGIAAGCSQKPLKFCPDDFVTRAEMAVFILKAIHEGESYSPPYDPEQKPIFADLQADNWKRKWAEALYKEKLTSGCATKPLRFCPDDKVKRSEMAVFLLKILEKLK